MRPCLRLKPARAGAAFLALLVVAGLRRRLMALGRRLARKTAPAGFAAAALVMTLAVDGLFLMAA